MRAIRLAPVVVLLFLVLAACSPTGSDTGVGPDLYTASLPENTKAQNDYVAAICTQAGGQVIQLANSVDCSDRDGWSTFVQAGMNDIDARCDAYLVWLDRRKRSSKPFLNQLAKTEEVTTTIVNSVSPGTAITVLTAVFGLARDTFNNINSVVLLETIDHSTVQSLVLRRQKGFREAIVNKKVPSRPAAIYVLRSYLRICMPITIATDINTTITSFDRGDTKPDPLIDAEAVANSLTPLGKTEGPGTSQQITGAITADEKKLGRLEFMKVQLALCLTDSGAFDPATRDGIRVYERVEKYSTPDDRLDTQAEINKLLKYFSDNNACPSSQFANYFERISFEGQKGPQYISTLQQLLNGADKLGTVTITANGKLDSATRAKIASVREFKDLAREGTLTRQVTPDLLKALGNIFD